MSNITAECITTSCEYKLNKEIRCNIDFGMKGNYICICSVMFQENDVCFVRIKSNPNLLVIVSEEDTFKLRFGESVICNGKVIEIF